MKAAKVNVLEPMVRTEVDSVMEGGNPAQNPEQIDTDGLLGGTDYSGQGREGRVHLHFHLQEEHNNAYLLG